jgi:hypothetical protein
VLHQFFDLSEFASTVATLVSFKHSDDISFFILPLVVTTVVIVVIVIIITSIPALSTEVAVYLPGRLRVVIEHA